MRVLLTGANGFIGRHLLAGLAEAGHAVTAAVRRPAALIGVPAGVRVVAADLNLLTAPESWRTLLDGIDAVVNCAGVLQRRPGQSVAAIHKVAPVALFHACVQAGVRRVVQISALGADAAAGTEYADTKRAAETALAAMPALEWVIVRPSLVHARGAYGGTSLLRGIAALPFAMPMPDGGRFQPIAMADLVETVRRALVEPALARKAIDAVGPETLTPAEIAKRLRAWLGFAPAPVLRVPRTLAHIAGRIGAALGATLSTTTLRQMERGSAGDPASFVAATGIAPRPMAVALAAEPAQTQDRWHARLYFVRPLLRLALGLMWLASGAIGLALPVASFDALLAPLGLGGGGSRALVWATCLWDIALGVAVLARWRTGLLALLQLGTVAAYTVALTLLAPALWADPFGPVLKNLPIMAAILALAAIEPDR